ncbi:MAG TPA: hypothetical protein VGQ00_03155, partial [Candidatus Norongarragalinales archaeon]|nr:hypothetical protein [Candidatus Norongarragalinales archaeon]
MSSEKNRFLLAIFVYGVLFLEVLSPLSIAQPVEPTSAPLVSPITAGGSCQVIELSAQERTRFFDNAFGFEAKEINALGKTPEGNFTPGSVPPVVVNVFSDTGSGLCCTLRDAAEVLGTPVNEASDFLGLPENATLNWYQANQLASRNPKSTPTDFVQRLLGRRQASLPSQPVDYWSNLMVDLPNGKRIALADLNNLQKLDQNNCLLDHSAIRGKVSYVALLDKNIVYGGERSNETLKASQHFTSGSSTVALSLHPQTGGANILIPSFFEKWLAFVGEFNVADLWISIASGASGLIVRGGGLRPLEGRQQKLTAQVDDARKLLAETSTANAQVRNQVSGALSEALDAAAARGAFAQSPFFTANALEGRAFIERGSSRVISINKELIGNTLEEGLITLPAGRVAANAQASIITAEKKKYAGEIVDKVTRGTPLTVEEFRNIGVDVPTVGGATPAPGEQILLPQEVTGAIDFDKKVFGEETRVAGLQKDLDSVTNDVKVFSEAQTAAAKRLQMSLMVGGLWLGPARFAFSINSAIVWNFGREETAKNRYVEVFVNNRDVIADFRRATNFLSSGTLLEKIGDISGAGAPTKAYSVNNVFLINTPQVTTSTDSVTALSSAGSSSTGWSITTNWKGSSSATNFEDLRGTAYDTTSLPLHTNGLPPNAVLARVQEGSATYELYTVALAYIVPFLATRTLGQEVGGVFQLVPWLAINDLILRIDPKSFENDACDESVLTNYKIKYGGASIAGMFLVYAAPLSKTSSVYKATLGTFFTTLSRAPIAGKPLTWFSNVLDATDFARVYQLWVGNEALRYVTSCKDQEYKVLAYQRLPEAVKTSTSKDLQSKLNPVDISKVLGSTQIGQVLGGVGQKAVAANLQEILNLRSNLQDQYGVVSPSEVYYLHLDQADQQWWGVFEKACLAMCHDDGNKLVCATKQGTFVTDKKTGQVTQLSDGEHSQLAVMRQDLGRTVIPNKVIKTSLSCDASRAMLEIDNTNELHSVDASCGTTACIQQSLLQISGLDPGSDFGAVLGKVVSVYTNTGRISIEQNGVLRFVQTNATGETVFPQTNGQITAAMLSASRISVNGDASVKISGFPGTTVNAGELRTIITDRGKIEYDPSSKTLYVALYILAKIPAADIKAFTTKPAVNLDEKGRPVPAIAIDQVIGQPGKEQQAAEFKRALDKIQAGGGLQMFETADHVYYFTLDDNGKPVLKIRNKKTGEVSTFNITGDMRRDGNDIVVPTDKGEFRFNLGMDEK